MMAIRVRPGIEQTRPMSRTPNVRKAEWDLIRGNHQGQRQLRCIKQAGHKTAPDLMSKLQKILAMQEPSTQDINRLSQHYVTRLFFCKDLQRTHPQKGLHDSVQDVVLAASNLA